MTWTQRTEWLAAGDPTKPGPGLRTAAWRWSNFRFPWTSLGSVMSWGMLLLFPVLFDPPKDIEPWEGIVWASVILGAVFLFSLGNCRAWFSLDPDKICVHRRGSTRCYQRDSLISISVEMTRRGGHGTFVAIDHNFGVERTTEHWLPGMSMLGLSKIADLDRELKRWRASGEVPSAAGSGFRLSDVMVLRPRVGWIALVYAGWAAAVIGAEQVLASVSSLVVRYLLSSVLYVSAHRVAILLCRSMWWASPKEVGILRARCRRAQPLEISEVRRSRVFGVDRLIVRKHGGTTIGRWSLLFAAVPRRDRDEFARAVQSLAVPGHSNRVE